MKTWIFLTGLVLINSFPLPAQTPAPDGLVSPDVHADHSVTFRLRAPNAREVTLSGDWLPVGQSEPLTKGADGVWSLHTTPLAPNGHLYWFNLDGVSIADPVNPVVKLRQRTSASLVEVPAQPGGISAATWRPRHLSHLCGSAYLAGVAAEPDGLCPAPVC